MKYIKKTFILCALSVITISCASQRKTVIVQKPYSKTVIVRRPVVYVSPKPVVIPRTVTTRVVIPPPPPPVKTTIIVSRSPSPTVSKIVVIRK